MPADNRPQMSMIRSDRLAGADLLEKQVARHLEEEVADEEDAGAQSVYRIAEAQIGFHLELSEADIDPIQIREDVTDEQKRNQSPRYLGIDVRWASGSNCPIPVARIDGCALHDVSFLGLDDRYWPDRREVTPGTS